MGRALRTPQVLCLAVFLAAGVPAWAQPFGYSINSRGNFTDDDMINALWEVDLATGESVHIGWTGFLDVEGLAFDTDGVLFGADDESNTLIQLSLVSGFGVAVNNELHNMGIPIDQVMDFGMAFTCSGELFLVADARHELYRGDVETGMIELVGAPGSLGAPITDIAAWGPDVYGIGQGLDGGGAIDSPNLYRIDPAAGTSELIGPLGAGASPYNNAGLAFDADGMLWAITDRRAVPGGDFPSEILRIDPATGAAEKIGETTFDSEALVGLESLAIGAPGGCGVSGDLPDSPENGPFNIPVSGRPALIALLVLVLGFGLLRLRT